MTFVFLRIAIGSFFIFSGFEKLIQPYQNFLYVVESYALVGTPLDRGIALVVPWLELLTGVFLVLGLWLKISLKVLIAFLISFIFAVSQAMIRKLPITECGCFGDFSLPLSAVLLLDSCLLVITSLLYRYLEEKTSRFSLDRYFQK